MVWIQAFSLNLYLCTWNVMSNLSLNFGWHAYIYVCVCVFAYWLINSILKLIKNYLHILLDAISKISLSMIVFSFFPFVFNPSTSPPPSPIQGADNTLWNCAPETNVIFLASVSPLNSVKRGKNSFLNQQDHSLYKLLSESYGTRKTDWK